MNAIMRTPPAHVDPGELYNFITFFFFFFWLEEPSDAFHYLLHPATYSIPWDVPNDTEAGVNVHRFMA